MKSIYIAGPMTGYPNFNFEAFFAAQKKLENEGWKVWNPANKDEEDGVTENAAFASGNDQLLMASGWSFEDAFLWDVTKVIQSRAIYMLPGWEASSGARAEHAIAVSMKARYPEYQIIYG